MREAKGLRRRMTQRRWSEASYARLEQSLMIGFYFIRRLAEAKTLSKSTLDSTLTLTTYPSNDTPVALMNWLDLDRLYNLGEAGRKQMHLVELCNQFIHSYVLIPVFIEEGGLHSALFCSDRRRNSELYEVRAGDIINVFDLVGNDYPDTILSCRLNERTGDYEIALEQKAYLKVQAADEGIPRNLPQDLTWIQTSIKR